MAEVFKADNIIKYYKKNPNPVVDQLSIELKRGEIVGLLGPNGSGKSTFFDILAGLIEPDAGNIYIDNKDITKLPLNKRAKLGIGYYPQESTLFKRLTVYDNILLVLETISPNYRTDWKKTIIEILAEFNLEKTKDNLAANLSGGEKRRLEFACISLIKPKFLLIDEPLSGVDPIATAEIYKQVQKLQSKNIGILITDHNVTETLRIVERGYIIYNGKLLTEGKTQELVKSDLVKTLYLGKNFNMNNEIGT